MKATNDQIIKTYAQLKSVWKVAEMLGMCGQSVHERLQKLELIESGKWSEDEDNILRTMYLNTSSPVGLENIPDMLKRTKAAVACRANELGLTSRNRAKSENHKVIMSANAKLRIAIKGHPKGMLGKNHSEETKVKIGKLSSLSWSKYTEDQKDSRSVKIQKTRIANGNMPPQRPETTWKSGWREIGGKKKFYRSRWEANYAMYLEWLKVKGEIKDWAHESKTFWFEGIKRGCMSYLPDFHVIENNGKESYHEVKGWMDDRSKTKIKRMAKYFPEISLVVIDSKAYKDLRKKVSCLIEGWEL